MSDIEGTKISQLPLGENLADDDLMLAVEDGLSKKVEIEYLKNRFVGDLTLADLGDDSTHRLVTDAEKTAWSGKQNALTFDNAPTENSNNPVKSGGVYSAINEINSDVATIIDVNLYDAEALTKGYVDNDGVVQTANVYYVTPRIDVSNIVDIYYSGYTSDYGIGKIYFYTNDNTPIKGYFPGTGKVMLHVPENAKSVIFTIKNTDIDTVSIRKLGKVNDMDVDLHDTQNTANFIQESSIKIVYGNNLFNKNSVVDGEYYNEDGLIRSNVSMCHSNPIEVTAGETYSCSPKQYTISFFDKNMGFIGCTAQNVGTFTTPVGTTRIIYNMLTSQKNDAMLNLGSSVLPYEAFSKSIELVGSEYDIIVAKDGSGQYTSLTTAVANCSSGATIYVKNGLYENEEIKASGKTVYVFGQSREGVIITNDYNDYSKPPLEAAAGIFENLTIYEALGETQAQVLGYACHIDYDYSYGKSLTFRNVTFKNDNYQALGIGMRGEFDLRFENCEMYSKDRVAFYLHESVASSTKLNQNVMLNNCLIHSNGSDQTLRLISYEQSNSSVNISFINCSVANEATQAVFYFGNIEGEGGAQTRVFTIADLVNFHLSKISYGNQLSVLNYGE